MKVLVTGGAGFIGSHVVDLLVEGGHEVQVLDSLDPAAHAGRPDYLNPKAEYEWADVQDSEQWERRLEGVDAVCHQAAKVGLGVDFDDAEAYVRANDGGTATMLRQLHRAGFRGRLALASSMVVYGEGRYRCPSHGIVRPAPRDRERLEAGQFEPPCPSCRGELAPEAVPEEAPFDPRNVYAATKVHQEHLCELLAREHDVPYVALRYHNVYGPRMPRDTPYAGVASIFRSALERGEPPQLFEDGRQLRDFVHVRDVARATVLALTIEPPAIGVFNIASGTPHTVGEMAEALSAAFGPGARAPEVTGRFRSGDVRHIFASTHLAAETLEFRPEIEFEKGMVEFASAPLRAAAESRLTGQS
jgi:dTDP-L-rhamnose 4-epimerase